MAKTKRAGTVQRTSTAPPASGVPVAAPMRPAEPDEVETARIKKTDPHRVGVDHTHTKLKADVAAAQQRLAHKKATGKLPAPPKPAAKPVAKTASKAAAKAKKKSAAQPAVTPPISY